MFASSLFFSGINGLYGICKAAVSTGELFEGFLDVLTLADGGQQGADFDVFVTDHLIVGIQSSKTTSIRPLEPLERDFMSIYDLMYDGLMTINDDYLPECDLAEEYECTNNGKTWTFRLKEDLVFADGTPVTLVDYASAGQEPDHNVCAWIKTK